MWHSWSEARLPAETLSESSLRRDRLGFRDTLLDKTSTEDAAALRHPSAQAISKLWKAYLSHVHPTTKLFFDWEKGPLLEKAADDPEAMSSAERALAFAIYFITFQSLSEEECEQVVGDSNRRLRLDDFQNCTETALLAAGFLATSNLLVLQAFLLYLVMRSPLLCLYMLMLMLMRTSSQCAIVPDQRHGFR